MSDPIRASAHPPVAWTDACLQVDDRVGRYRCAGIGPLVLCLLRAPDAASRAAADALAGAHRVLVPEPQDDWLPWLVGCVDVFGMRGEVTLVADAAAWPDLLALAEARFDRVGALRRVEALAAAVSSAGTTLPRLGEPILT